MITYSTEYDINGKQKSIDDSVRQMNEILGTGLRGEPVVQFPSKRKNINQMKGKA